MRNCAGVPRCHPEEHPDAREARDAPSCAGRRRIPTAAAQSLPRAQGRWREAPDEIPAVGADALGGPCFPLGGSGRRPIGGADSTRTKARKRFGAFAAVHEFAQPFMKIDTHSCWEGQAPPLRQDEGREAVAIRGSLPADWTGSFSRVGRDALIPPTARRQCGSPCHRRTPSVSFADSSPGGGAKGDSHPFGKGPMQSGRSRCCGSAREWVSGI